MESNSARSDLGGNGDMRKLTSLTTPAIIQGILRYLAEGRNFDGKVWYNTIRSNNDYPHALWWHDESGVSSHNDYNPTACLAGFIVRFANRDSDLYRLGRRIAEEAYDAYFGQDLPSDMHAASCYLRLWQDCTEAGVTDLIDLAALKERLRKQVRHCISSNIGEWKQAMSVSRRNFCK